MKRILLSIAVSALLNDAIGWISQPDISTFQRRSSLSFQSPMAPMDFIDVEITGHAKESSNSSKRESTIKEEDKARTKEILMPSITPAMTKGKIVEWLVRTGDTIRKGDPIMVIESEKEVQGARGYRMNQDVHANVDGVLAAIYQQPGQAVNVGAVLGIIVPDFIIDAEIEGQTVKPDEDDNKSETEEQVVTTTKMNEGTEASASAASTKAPREPTLMDEMMPQTQDVPKVNLSPDVPSATADWVHGHHATTDGMANDHSFYSAHTTQPSGVGADASRVSTKARNDIGIDSTDPFYSPYGEGGPGPGVGGPGPGPFAPPPYQPGPSMKPNGATDNFYEAYQDSRDPFQQQSKQWEQNVVANSNMGDYYQAERNGQTYGGGVRSNPSSAPMNPPVSTSGPNVNVNGAGAYGGYDISSTPNNVSQQPQEIFVKGVSPDAPATRDVDPQDGYSSGFVNPTTGSTTTTTSNAYSPPPPQKEPPITVESTATTTPVDSTVIPPPPSATATPPTAERTETASTTTTSEASPSVVPPTVDPPSPPAFDQTQVDAMESRISSLEESLRNNHGQVDSFKTTVQAELDSLKKELADVKQNYDDKVKKLEESYQTSLSQVGRDFSTSMEELRDWDTLTVTWDIKDFEKTLQSDLTTYTSEEFNVAGYSMTLEMQIFETNNEGSRDVGFYIMHTGGLNYVPIMIGGSKITIQSTMGNEDAIKVFVDDASIEDSHYGWGWKKFFSLQDLKQSFVNSKGEIQVTASVRVKRVKSCRINTAI